LEFEQPAASIAVEPIFSASQEMETPAVFAPPPREIDFWKEAFSPPGGEWSQSFCIFVEVRSEAPSAPVIQETTIPLPDEKEAIPPETKTPRFVTKTIRTEDHPEPAAEKPAEDNIEDKNAALDAPAVESPPEPAGTEIGRAASPDFSGEQTVPAVAAIFPSLTNPQVGKFVDFFQTKADSFFQSSLTRSRAYSDMIRRILREKEIPEEFVYLALIESGFNPRAYSRAKASGIWQFVTKTAKRFGLKVNAWVDERRDPEKATYAAAAYLKSLYEMFNSWDLAAASYNAGEGKVLKAMRKAKSQDFWEISRHAYLKKETKEYVPMFLAAVTIAQDPQKYGFQEVESQGPLNYDKVKVPGSIHLERIAKAAKMDLSELRALNPALRREKTPPDSALFEINLPPGKKEVFEKNFRTQTASKKAKKNRVCPGRDPGIEREVEEHSEGVLSSRLGKMKVVGNRDSKRYHLPGMRYYYKVEAYHRVEFDSEEKAIQAGYHKAPR
jgi:soluble lytic murein transglycosylase-like protein